MKREALTGSAFRSWVGLLGIGFGIMMVSSAVAQVRPPEWWEYPDYRSDHVVVALKVGPVYTSPEGKFPSLLIGESINGSGEVPAEYAETGHGFRLGLDGYFPFGKRGGLLLELASQRNEVKYSGDSTLLPTVMEIQTFQIGVGGEVNLYYHTPGILRAVFLAGGFDFGFGPLANRVTASAITDSTTGERVEATGSFINNDPFTTSVALQGTLGVRFGLDATLELLLEGGYVLPLNHLFSSNVVEGNDLKLRHLIVSGGIGFRF